MNNIANGNYSLAAGRNAKALHDGTFVWGDSSDADISSTGENQFIVRATGGVQFRTAVDRSVGVRIQPGSGTWSSLSDRSSKDDFETIDPHAILDAVAKLPITTWRYKAQGTEVRHMGPVAQDFRAAFALGEDEQHISSVDADGVALAAIQGLYDIVSTLKAENEELKHRIDELEAR